MKIILTKLKAISGIYLFSAGIFLFGSIILIGIFLYQPAGDVSDIAFELDDDVMDKNCEYHRLLDGVCVEDKQDVDPPLVGIMIENHYDARPLSGLGLASVVYEAPVEGNFNRFLAIYPADAPVTKAGPVRSARPYYLDWVSEYPGMMYMHVGGSPDALSDIKKYDLFDINEMYRGWYFWRSKDRYMPHNVYTSQELWEKAMADYGETGSGMLETGYEPWTFASMDACAEDCVEKITTTYSGQTYQATWKYNTSTEQYERYELGDAVFDAGSGDHVAVDTLIVQYVDTTVLDGVGRLGMDTIGSGEAIVFRNGFKVEGEWQKDSREGRTVFVDSADKAIALKPGKIWIVVMNRVGEVSFNMNNE